MSIANLSHVLKIFSGSNLSSEEENSLFRETLLMTLARASSTDANIDPVEINTVQAIIRDATGDEISDADIRVAAASELYESAPLEKYLSSCGRTLSASSRAAVIRSLASVIRSDTKVTAREVEFFNMVAGALAVTASEVAGLVAD
jgi:uncharacterized tellurite resistance protein B-like protein